MHYQNRLFNRSAFLNAIKKCLLLGLGLFAMLPSLAWSDCQSSYTQAVTLLDATTQKASQNEHPNSDAFSADFKTIVASLQTQKCMPELMSLIQHIQSEQQKMPTPPAASGKGNVLPITD